MSWVVGAVILLGVLVLMIWEFRSECYCGKVVPWYISRRHPKSRIIFAWGLLISPVAVFDIFTIHTAWDIVWTLYMVFLAAWEWIRLYKHEKDKIKKAAKALGRVVIKDNGRLAIET